MLKNSVFIIFLALFLSACSFETKALIQTNNEGIFIQAKKNQSINLHIHNPSKIPNDLENKLIAKFKDLNFNLKDKNADYDIFINIVDFKKYSYAQRLRSSSAKFFFNDFDRIDDVFEMEVENYYLMQVNLQVNSYNLSQKTSLLARTTHLGNLNDVKQALEDKIVEQIISFFYF